MSYHVVSGLGEAFPSSGINYSNTSAMSTMQLSPTFISAIKSLACPTGQVRSADMKTCVDAGRCPTGSLFDTTTLSCKPIQKAVMFDTAPPPIVGADCLSKGLIPNPSGSGLCMCPMGGALQPDGTCAEVNYQAAVCPIPGDGSPGCPKPPCELTGGCGQKMVEPPSPPDRTMLYAGVAAAAVVGLAVAFFAFRKKSVD
jgi:hypothetical protein